MSSRFTLSLQYVLTCLLGPLKEKCALLEKSSHWAGKECQILTERIRNTRSKLGNLRYKYLVYIFSHILEKKQSCNIGKLGTVTVWQTNQCMGGENTHINDYIMITDLKQQRKEESAESPLDSSVVLYATVLLLKSTITKEQEPQFT